MAAAVYAAAAATSAAFPITSACWLRSVRCIIIAIEERLSLQQQQHDEAGFTVLAIEGIQTVVSAVGPAAIDSAADRHPSLCLSDGPFTHSNCFFSKSSSDSTTNTSERRSAPIFRARSQQQRTITICSGPITMINKWISLYIRNYILLLI